MVSYAVSMLLPVCVCTVCVCVCDSLCCIAGLRLTAGDREHREGAEGAMPELCVCVCACVCGLGWWTG